MTDNPDLVSVCIFCKEGPINTEDIFPRWIHRYLGRKPATTFESGLSIPSGTFQGFDLTATANCVCRKCNGGWMSDLENETSRILKRMFDEKVSLSLSGDSLGLLSRWCMKTALMIQFIRDIRAIPVGVYERFFEARTPPASSLGFIARHVGQISNGTNSILYAINAGRPEEGQLYGVTFFIKNVVVQIIGADFDGGLNIRLPHAFTGQVQPLWPEGPSVVWPPPTRLNDEAVLAYARSLLELQG